MRLGWTHPALLLALNLSLGQLAGCGGQADAVRPPEAPERTAPAAVAPATDPADQIRLRSIQELQQAELTGASAAERAALLEQLARLMLDQQASLTARAARLREIAENKPEHHGVFERNALDLERQAAAWRDRAIETLGRLIRDHSQHPRTDEHLFQLAAALQAAKRSKEALAMSKILIARHPQSQFVPDAYLMFAEHYFAQAQLDKAVQLYEKVIAYPEAAVSTYARYKLAWCHFNLGQFQEALAGFIEIGREQPPESQLGREARKDSVLAYAQAARADQAVLFFHRQFPKQALDLLDQLARTWRDQGRYADQRQIDESLLARLGCRALALEVRLRSLQSCLAEGSKPKAIEQAEALVAQYRQLAACLPADQERADLEQTRAEAARWMGDLVRAWQIEQAKSPPQLGSLTDRLREAFGDLNTSR